jgi:predicted RND superfamily exporter protein
VAGRAVNPAPNTAGAAILLRRRVWVLVAVLAVLAPLLPFLLVLDVNNSSDIWFDEDDPVFGAYIDFLEEFGSDNVLIVALPHEDPFTPEALGALKTLTALIADVENVEQVASLATMPVVRHVMGIPVPGRLLDPLPGTPLEAQALREKAMADELALGRLVSADGRTTFIIAQSKPLPLDGKIELIRRVKDLLASDGRRGYRLSGIPLLDAEFARMSTRENRIFIPVSLGMVLIVLFVLYRSFRVMAACSGVVFLSLGVTLGVFAATGRTFNIMTSLVPPLLVAIGIADTVHLLNHYIEELNLGRNRLAALEEAMRRMFAPCLFTSLTTAVGFLSLVLADIRPVREAGIFGALGILVAFGFSFTFFPAVISFLPERIFLRRGGQPAGRDILKRLLLTQLGWVLRARWPVMALAAVVAVFAVMGLFRLMPETFVLNFFREDNEVRRSWEFMEEKGLGVSSAQIVLEGEPGSFRTAEGLVAIDAIETAASSIKGVRKAISVVDFLRYGERLFGGDGKSIPRLAELLKDPRVKDTGLLRGYVNPDASRARVSLTLRSMSDRENLIFIAGLHSHFPNGRVGPFRYTVTGAAIVFSKLNRVLMRSQEKTALTACIAICLAMILLLRAPLLGLVGMIPNLLPIIVTLGLMGWFGISLDVGTMIIAGVAVGIAVDDTIHYLTRFRIEAQGGDPPHEVLQRCHVTVGKAIVYTSVILFCGFIVIGLSSFRPVLSFGLLTGLTMVFAMVGDLTLLPAILRVLPAWVFRRKS